MDVNQVVDIIRDALWVLIKISAPLMITALVVGLIVSMLQALTQIQEMTLTFVPKVLAMFAVLILVLPFMLQSMIEFNGELFTLISNIEDVE